MNCQDAKRFLGAFADGELETETNLAILEHVNMCPSCATRVADVQALKMSLQRIDTQQRVPAGLEERVRTSIRASGTLAKGQSERAANFISRGAARTEGRGSQEGGALRVAEVAATGTGWIYRLLAPASIAAAILVAVLIWRWPAGDLQPDPGTVTAPGASFRLVSDVGQQHVGCTRLGPKHHRESLGWSLPSIQAELSRELSLDVAAVDLSRFGYRFHSADSCGVMGRRGAHVVYQPQEGGPLLSLFSIEHVAGLESTHDDGGYAVDVGEDYTFITWHGRRTTYVFCAPLSPEALRPLADAVRAQRID